MGSVLVPVLLLLFLGIISAVLYVALHAYEWTENVDTRWDGFWFTIRLAVTYLSPLLVSVVAVVLLYRAILGYARAFYNLPEETRIFSLIQRRLMGIPPLPPPLSAFMRYPFVVIKEPQDLGKDHWIRWLGGPATLVIYDGLAFYLERGSRFSRVVGPGSPPMPFLDRHETVKAVIDLRPQVRTDGMNPWTKDGIQVEMKIRMECQINASEEARANSRNLVYPFDPIAVKQAVEYTSVKRNAETKELYESDWLDGIWGQVSGYLARHISCHSVDEIALAEIKDVGPSEGNLQTFQLAKDHIDMINQDLSTRRCGSHVNNIHVTLKFPKEVEEKRIAYWKSERNRITVIQESKAEADGIRVRQEARATAERDMLNAIMERLKRVSPDNLTEPLLLSLTGILENNIDDPLIRPLIAKQSLDLLEKLRDILKDRF
jgi:hypothetical protein